ncbi:MAG TPA: M20/M25/M40 family metallo-hydrolase [Thermoanaerobaculia bacterium]|nr:M20/M25/M40 family metallo-hydrolase [Thermoanaerobaculia bacterium]
MSAPPLEQRLQRASRVALYGSLALAMAASYGLVATLDRPVVTSGTGWIEHDYLHDPTVGLLQHYAQIDTSKTTGNEVAGARFLAAQLAAAGIHSEIEVLDGKHANLFAQLDGQDPHPLVLHNHIDVSGANPREWIYPPFSAHIELPWIFGRGVFDMKSIGIAQLLAMIDLKRSGRPLRRSVLFLATGDEESGDSRLGVQWVIRQRPELVHSFWAVLTEGGTVEARSRSDVKYWGTEIGQKHFAKLNVCSESRERLEDLRQFLLDRGYTETDLHLLPQIAEVLLAYGPSRDSALMREPLAHPQDLLGDIGAFRAMPPYLRSMLRNEAVPFHVEPAKGGGYRLLIMLHMLPGLRAADVRDQLLPPWLMHGLAVSLDEVPGSPLPSPTSHPAFREILTTLKTEYPDFRAGPFFLSWTATDSRFFRAAGVPSYGFSPFFIMSTDTYQVDAPNERLTLPGFLQGVELYGKLVRRLVL